MLFEEGRFQLSDPISKWLPEFKDLKVCGGAGRGVHDGARRSPITIRHLLALRTGCRTVTACCFRPTRRLRPGRYQGHAGRLCDPFSRDAAEFRVRHRLALQHFGRPRHHRPTGRGHFRTIAGSVSVGRILRPLKMNDPYFYLPEGKLPRFAATYRPDANKKIELDEAPTTNSLFFRERTYFSGTGGLVSTASDYLRFQLMLLNGGELDGVRILGPEDGGADGQQPHRQLVRTRRLRVWPWGVGARRSRRVRAVGSEGMFGWGGAFNTITFVDPKEDMIGIVMSQVRPNDHLNLRRDFQTLVYQALVSPQPNLVSSK